MRARTTRGHDAGRPVPIRHGGQPTTEPRGRRAPLAPDRTIAVLSLLSAAACGGDVHDGRDAGAVDTTAVSGTDSGTDAGTTEATDAPAGTDEVTTDATDAGSTPTTDGP